MPDWIKNNTRMSLPLVISRFSNFLLFVQKTAARNLVGFDFQKHFADKHFDIFFYGKNEKEILKRIGKAIGKQKTRHFQSSIMRLKPIFVSQWKGASKKLFLWKRYFQKNQLLFRQIIAEIERLSGIKHFTIHKNSIYLISDINSKNKEINARFSWTPKENFIVIEIPYYIKMHSNFFPISVLAHEFFHLVLRKNKKLIIDINRIAQENEKLLTKLSMRMPNRMFLEELLVSSFIPEGYLSEKYLNTKLCTSITKPKDLLSWRRLVAFKLRKTAKYYIDNMQKIDKKYLEHIVDILKQNTK